MLLSMVNISGPENNTGRDLSGLGFHRFRILVLNVSNRSLQADRLVFANLTSNLTFRFLIDHALSKYVLFIMPHIQLFIELFIGVERGNCLVGNVQCQ